MTFDLPKFASFCRTERFGRSKVNIGRSKVNIGRSKVNIGRSKVTTPPIASDFRVDGAKSPEIPQKEGVLGSDIAARNRKSLATFHRTLKSQCNIACLVSEIARFLGSAMGIAIANRKNRCDFGALRHQRFQLGNPRGHAMVVLDAGKGTLK